MEFNKVITSILLELDKHKIPYALIGAVAMGFWGIRRDTVDIDILVKKSEREKILGLMKSFGYDHLVSSNFADQFGHILQSMGLIDILYTNKEQGIIESSKTFKGLGDVEIQVALPEDLIGMKLDGIRNNPNRELQDWADIKAVVELLGENLDWNKIKEYCKITDMEDKYEKILSFK